MLNIIICLRQLFIHENIKLLQLDNTYYKNHLILLESSTSKMFYNFCNHLVVNIC